MQKGVRIGGVLVGGFSSRMGVAKGLLSSSGALAKAAEETILARTVRVLESIALTPVMIGRAADYSKIRPDVLRLSDATLSPGEVASGPLAGLAALLNHARAQGSERALLVACDMPKIEPKDLCDLIDHQVERAVLAAVPRRAGPFFEPFPGVYSTALLDEPAAKSSRSFQALFRGIEPQLMFVSLRREATLDWDSPEDLK